METKLEYIRYYQQLLRVIEQEGKTTLSGAMSPFLSAQEFSSLMGLGNRSNNSFPFNGLVRIVFNEEEVHNYNEGTLHKPSWTAYDTLVICQWARNDESGEYWSDFYSYIDGGCKLIPVAMSFHNDPPDNITLTPVYEKHEKYPGMKVLTKGQWRDIFTEIRNERIYLPNDYKPKL